MTTDTGRWLAPLGASAAVLAVYLVPGVLTSRDGSAPAPDSVVTSGAPAAPLADGTEVSRSRVRAVNVTGYRAKGRTLRVFYTIDRSTDCSLRIATPVVKEKVGAVVLRLDRRPSLTPGEVCADLRLTTSVDITLTRPMGGRVLQDASRGGSLVPLQPPYSSELAIPSPPGSM
jgi:hypothetical protein